MKIFTRTTNLVFVSLLLTLFVSCGESKDNQPQNAPKGTASQMLNIRYIDSDSLAANYNLAKDLSEAYLRSYENFQNVGRSKAAEIQKFEKQIATKVQNNGYLSQASYEDDMKKLQQMNVNAQNQLAALERNIGEEQAQNLMQINDSINNYLQTLCKEKGYEVVFNKNTSTFYIDAKYDITEEVVKGLNERYVKVKADK